ncbi:MAG: ABC transporter permease [Stellaceae bacterium]
MSAAERRRPSWRRAAAPADARGVLLLCWLIGGLLGAFIVLPLLALAITPSPASLAEAARAIDLWRALGLSLEAALLSALIAGLGGVPLAYVLARATFPGKGVVAAIVDLPLAVPHTVAGIALLLVLGRHGILGAPAAALFGLKFWGTLAGVVAAMLFVSVPYTVNAARIGFEAIDPRLEKIARTLGMGPWRSWLRVSLPLARRSILTGLTLTYARSISEFGAVIILAYYPMTAPVQIYTLFVRFGLDQAAAAAVLLLAVSLALFILFRQFAYRGVPRAAHGR